MTHLTVNIEKYMAECETMQADLEDLTCQVEECNLALSDLDHFLELEELTEEELRRIQHLRKCTLSARRKSKDRIRVIEQILPKQVEGRTTRDRYEYAVRNLDNRVYTPRKITLKEALGYGENDDS